MWLKKLVIIINQTWIHCFWLLGSQDYFITIWFHFHNKTRISADTMLGRRGASDINRWSHCPAMTHSGARKPLDIQQELGLGKILSPPSCNRVGKMSWTLLCRKIGKVLFLEFPIRTNLQELKSIRGTQIG